MAQHHDRAVLLRQTTDLLMKRLELLESRRVRSGTRFHFRAPLFLTQPLPGSLLRSNRNSSGDTVQPRAKCLAPANRASVAHKDQEGGLKGVLGGVRIPRNTKTHAPDQGTMSRHQSRKRAIRPLVPPRPESLQELAVVHSRGRPGVEKRLDRPEDRTLRPASHFPCPLVRIVLHIQVHLGSVCFQVFGMTRTFSPTRAQRRCPEKRSQSARPLADTARSVHRRERPRVRTIKRCNRACRSRIRSPAFSSTRPFPPRPVPLQAGGIQRPSTSSASSARALAALLFGRAL